MLTHLVTDKFHKYDVHQSLQLLTLHCLTNIIQYVVQVQAYEYLGCVIPWDLKREIRISAQVNKCNKRLFPTRQLINLNVKCTILCLYYNTMI